MASIGYDFRLDWGGGSTWRAVVQILSALAPLLCVTGFPLICSEQRMVG
jgi:hypothetical protein